MSKKQLAFNIFNFLKQAKPYIQSGEMTKDKAFEFLNQKGVEVTGIIRQALDNAFKPAPKTSGDVIDVSFKPGMSKSGKFVEESPSQKEGIGTLADYMSSDTFGDFSVDQGNFLQRIAKAMKENRKRGMSEIIDGDDIKSVQDEFAAKRLNAAKPLIDKLDAKTADQKIFLADTLDDMKQGIFDNVDFDAVVRSNAYDDLLKQGVDDDTLLNIFYSDKTGDFATRMEKIKAAAKTEGLNIDDTIDFYTRAYQEFVRPGKAEGGSAQRYFSHTSEEGVNRYFDSPYQTRTTEEGTTIRELRNEFKPRLTREGIYAAPKYKLPTKTPVKKTTSVKKDPVKKDPVTETSTTIIPIDTSSIEGVPKVVATPDSFRSALDQVVVGTDEQKDKMYFDYLNNYMGISNLFNRRS